MQKTQLPELNYQPPTEQTCPLPTELNDLPVKSIWEQQWSQLSLSLECLVAITSIEHFSASKTRTRKKTLVSTLYQISYREKYLSLVWTPVITAMKSGTDTYQICDDPLSKSARRSYRTAPKSPLSCMNKSPFWYGFYASAIAIRYSEDIALIALPRMSAIKWVANICSHFDRTSLARRKCFITAAKREIPTLHDRPILSSREANHNTAFTSTCPLVKLAIS